MILDFRRPRVRKTQSYDKWRADNPNAHWDRKTSQILRKYKESVHPVVPGTTIFEQETVKQKKGKESIHSNASMETANRMFKLIESVTFLCILLVVMKYMDDLPEETLIEAQESNTAQVKPTPRVRESCACSRSNRPSRSDKPLARTKKKKGTSTHDCTVGRRVALRAQSNRHHTRDGENCQKRGLPISS